MSVVEAIAPYLNHIGPKIVTLICLIWLGYRASSLLILPVDQVIRLLNLDVPPPPTVVLEAVTSDTISLRWQVPDKQSVSKHLIQLNGSIIGESDKKDTNVLITGLNPDHLYCIRVIAANSQRLHSASETIRVRTKPNPPDAGEDTSDHVPIIHTHPPPSEPPPPSTTPAQSRHRLSSARDQPVRRLSNATKAEQQRTRSNSAVSTTPPTLDSLTDELDRVNREIGEITAQLESEEIRNSHEIQKLESELEDLRARRKEDDDSKASIKAETKALEEQKRSVDATKSKLERQLRSVQEELAKLDGEASARLRDLAEKEQELADLVEQTLLAERRAKEAKTVGREGLQEVQKHIAVLEETNRELAQRILHLKGQAEKGDTDEEKAARRRSIDETEDREDLKMEQAWIESERELKARHDLVKAELNEANREYREALALLVQARELHTVAHPPLPPSTGKHRNKKQRSRRARKALNMIGQHNASSPSLTPSDPSINSRPTSLALPTGSDIGLMYPDYSEPSLQHFDYQGGSPWASTHSLGLRHEIPLPVETIIDREQLTGGALLSPSVSEHLLPSNLFGPEDDSIRTSPYIDQLLQTSPTASVPVSTPIISTSFQQPIPRGLESPVSEISTRSSFSSPNQSHPALPFYDRHLQEPQTSPTIIMTPAPYTVSEIEIVEPEEVEVTSPAELGGIPLSGENTDEETALESTESSSPLKHWKIPSLPFRRKVVPPEKRLPILGTLKGEKARSMPRTNAGAIPIGFNRPRSGSGSSSGWLQTVTRARAPSETGRQFDINFDPLESRRLLEGAGVVHHHSALSNPLNFPFTPSPRASFESRSSIMSRRSTDTDMARMYTPKGAYYRSPSVYSEVSSSYGWISQPNSATTLHPPLSLPTSPSAALNATSSPLLNETWSPPTTSRSSLDPKAPEFRTSLQQFLPGEEVPEVPEIPEISPKRGGGRFSLSRRSTLRPGDGFLNNFTGLFRRDASKPAEDEENELTRPKSRDTQASGEPVTSSEATAEGADDTASEITPEKKKKERKKKEKAKGKSIFRWESKAEPTDDPELASSKSMESVKMEEPETEQPVAKKKKKKAKKGVKFEQEEGEVAVSTSSPTQETGPYFYQGKEVTLDEVPVKVLDYFR